MPISLALPRPAYSFAKEYYPIILTAEYLNNLFKFDGLFTEQYLTSLCTKEYLKRINSKAFLHKEMIARIIYHSSLAQEFSIKTIDEFVAINSLTDEQIEEYKITLPKMINLRGAGLALAGIKLWIHEAIFGLEGINLAYGKDNAKVNEQLEQLFPNIKNAPMVWDENSVRSHLTQSVLNIRNQFLQHLINQEIITLDDEGYCGKKKNEVWCILNSEYETLLTIFNSQNSPSLSAYPTSIIQFVSLRNHGNIFVSGKDDFFNTSKNPDLKKIIRFKHGRKPNSN